MRRRTFVFAVPLLLLAPAALADEQVIPLTGTVEAGDPRHVLVPFEVPAGTVEIEVLHDDQSEDNILDWGLYDDKDQFRGWGGGNVEPAVVGVDRASRSYLPGPIQAGTWKVVIGKAKIAKPPATYALEIHLRDVGTLAAQPERAPYRAAAPLAKGARWYAGDLHVHSRESGDADPTLDTVADFARTQGLDFVELSEHNTVSQLDFIVDAQSRHPDLLFLPGVEWTTYQGHGNGIGATSWVDHKLGVDGVTVSGAAQAFADQGALFTINHPTLDLGDLCIGCAWDLDLEIERIDGVEVINGAADIFTPKSIKFWDDLCAQGRHVAAIGGSDDHTAGVDEGALGKPIGTAQTMVFADELSAQAIIDGIRAGRTVVRRDPESPMIELTSSVAPTGDTVVGAFTTTLKATVTKGLDHVVRFVHNGEAADEVEITSDPFELTVEATAPTTGEDRWRVEVLDGRVRTLTSHLWIAAAKGPPPTTAASGGPDGSGESDSGCGCAVPGSSPRSRSSWLVVAAALMGALRRRRSR